MTPDDDTPPDYTPIVDGATPPGALPEAPPSGSRGSDPPARSGDPAARQAGDGAPEGGPPQTSEIDRSTDA